MPGVVRVNAIAEQWIAVGLECLVYVGGVFWWHRGHRGAARELRNAQECMEADTERIRRYRGRQW